MQRRSLMLQIAYSSSSEMANYQTYLDSYRKIGSDERVFEELFDKFKPNDLEEVESCIAVGPGPGLNELNFLRKLTPNLKCLTCVEKDDSCVAALNENLKKHLPKNVKAKVNQIFVQDWEGPEERVDVVLMFHCLYFDDKERIDVLRRCMHDWLKPGGRLYVMMLKDVNEGENHIMNEVYRRHGVKTLAEAFHVKKNIESLGFQVDKEHSYHSIKPLDQVDSGFIGCLKFHSEPTLSENQIKETLKKLQEELHGGRVCGTLFSVKNK